MSFHNKMRTAAVQAHGVALLAALLSSLSVAAPAPSQPAEMSGCSAMSAVLPPTLSMQANFQESIMLPEPVLRLAVAEPTIADVALVAQRNLLIHARKGGSTSLLVWTRCNSQPIKVQINVQGQSAQLTQKAKGESLAELPSQIQADIRFVELSRSKFKDIGTRITFGSLNRPNFFGSPGGTGSVTAGTPPGPASLGLNSDAFNIIWGGSSQRFLGAIDLLEQSGYAYTLAQPSLVAMSGQTANFLAGGEIPIPVPQSGNSSSITIDYKEFGVRLSLTPTIVSANKIILKVAPEVSDLDFTNAITIQGSIVPALRIRRTDTTISMADGESFIISGLISRSTISNADKFPGLGDLPILGALFRSTRFEAEDRELLMIVTPRLVRPLAVNARMPVMPGDEIRRHDPGAAELFFLGDSEDKPVTSTGLSR